MVEQAEIHRKAQSIKIHDRIVAANQFHDNFSNLPDKKQAWEDLFRLIHDETEVKWRATRAFVAAFPYILDKNQAWEELIQLTKDRNREVCYYAAYSISACFPYVPDKTMAWEDLHRLTQDKNNIVLLNAANALGASFSQIPNKKQAWEDLNRLADNENNNVRISANYSLGRASIFKASEAGSEDKFKRELEKALRFFKTSSNEATYENPARFCLLFYKSFYTITFKKMKSEVRKYLVLAKNAVEGSESKEKLIEAVDNLANALIEAQNAQKMSFENHKSVLKACRGYCERAAELLETTEEKAPLATKIIKKGLPIIDEKIKRIITEVRENAKVFCKKTLDTPLEKLGKEINQIGQDLLKIRDPIGLEKGEANMQNALSAICAKMPEKEKGEACELLKKVNDEPFIEDKINLINMVLSKISSQISTAKSMEVFEKKLDEMKISMKPGIREELVISVGGEVLGTGAKHEIHIPLQEISYPDLKKDLEKIKGGTIQKLSSIPAKLAEKVKDYLIRNRKDELLKKLS